MSRVLMTLKGSDFKKTHPEGRADVEDIIRWAK